MKGYYIQNGVRRAVASQRRLLPDIPAVVYRAGQAPETIRVPVSQLYSPKKEIVMDQRFLAIVPPIRDPIEVEPLGLAGQQPSVPIPQVKLLPQGKK